MISQTFDKMNDHKTEKQPKVTQHLAKKKTPE